ncbi:MAG: TolC family protein [Candidatus Kapaibacterium sp.]
MRRRILLASVLLLYTIPWHVAAQSIDSLLSMAMRTDPGFRQIEFAEERAEARARSAGAWDAPKAGVQFQMLSPLNPNPVTKGETMFMVEQMIPLGGQKRTMAEAERSMAILAEPERMALERRLRREIEEEYYTMWEIDKKRELNRENRSLAELLYEDVEIKYTLSRGAQTDLYGLSIEIEGLDAEMKILAQKRKESSRRLNAIVGRSLDDSVVIVDEPDIPPLPPFNQLADSLASHPDLLRMERMAQVERKMADAARSDLKPMLMVRGGISWMPEGHPVRTRALGEMVNEFHSSGATHGEQIAISVGGMLSFPLSSWSRSGPEGKAEDAELAAEESLAERERMLREMTAMLSKPYGMIERGQTMVDFYQDRQIPLLEQQLEALRADYIGNRVGFDRLLEVYKMLVMSREEILMREGEMARAWGEIRALTGNSK